MGETPIGTVAMSYWIDPCGLNGQPINGGNHYANADTAEDARATAERMLAGGEHLGYTLGSVTCDGRELEFVGSGWAPLTGGRTDYFEVTRAEVGLPPVFLRRDETTCWDSTALDYYETVHAMKSDGTCQCGDPTRNVRR